MKNWGDNWYEAELDLSQTWRWKALGQNTKIGGSTLLSGQATTCGTTRILLPKREIGFILMAGNNHVKNGPFKWKISKVDCCFVGVRCVGPWQCPSHSCRWQRSFKLWVKMINHGYWLKTNFKILYICSFLPSPNSSWIPVLSGAPVELKPFLLEDPAKDQLHPTWACHQESSSSS